MKLLQLGSIISNGRKKWKVAAVMNVGERFYLLTNPKDKNDVGFFPASWVESWKNVGILSAGKGDK